MKKYYSIPQAAKICSVNSSTMYRWATAGKIKSYTTAGGHRRILPEDLKDWMKKNSIPFDMNVLESSKAKILIVDDDASVRSYLKKALSGIFIHIDFATDGFEAGIKMAKFNPNLIILDLFMPNMDGFQVCKKIKADPATRAIKILILSGHLTDKNLDEIRLSGADAALSKPVSKTELVACVETLLTNGKRN